MDLFSWFGRFTLQPCSGSIRRRLPQRLQFRLLEELEARALPNDCFLSLLHAADASANAGLHATASQPPSQACGFDQLEQNASLFDVLVPIFPSDIRSAARSTFSTNKGTGGRVDYWAEDRLAATPGDSFLAGRAQPIIDLDPFASCSSESRGGASIGLTIYGSRNNASPATLSAVLAVANALETRQGIEAVNRGISTLPGVAQSGLVRSQRPHSPAKQNANGSFHALVGYWHNFRNGAGPLRLRDVSSQFDIVDVAFGIPAPGSTSRIQFSVDTSIESDAQFRSDVVFLQSQGKAVLLSIGGATGHVQLNTAADLNNFVSSVGALIQSYGFDGFDIDFEGSSVVLGSGDTDFTNPTTPLIVNLNSALRQLYNQFGCIISMAPETFFVQAGFSAYGGAAGAYLPVIYGSQDILSYIHVQDYNSGSMTALDGRNYSQGTADFHVALTEMMLQGFPVAGGRSGFFPALAPQQVAFGVPASPQAGAGFTSIASLQNALRYLVEGIPFGGTYQLMNPAGYPDLLGLMTWSINWDRASGFQLSNTIGPYLHSLP